MLLAGLHLLEKNTQSSFILWFTFYNPPPQVHRQNLRSWLYAQQLKQAQDNHQTYTQKDSLNSPFDL